MHRKLFDTKEIFDIPVANVTLKKISQIIFYLMKNNKKVTVFGVNPHSINLANSMPEFKKVMREATLAYPEGVGTILAAKVLRKPLTQKTNLLDFMFPFLELAQQKKLTLFLLGGIESVNFKASNFLASEFPNLRIVGRDSGYFTSNDKVIGKINRKKPDILFVAMGSPKQELWIAQNIDKISARVFFGIGGSIDILSGKISRSPAWLRNIGLDWFFRFLIEPRRLWKRYIVGNFIFLFLLFSERANVKLFRTMLLKLPQEYL